MTFSQIYGNRTKAARGWRACGLCHVFVRLWNEFEAAGFRVKRGMTIIIAKLLTKTMSPQKFSAPDEVGRTLWASALFVRGRNGAQCTNASYIAPFFQRGTGFMAFSNIYENEAKAARV